MSFEERYGDPTAPGRTDLPLRWGAVYGTIAWFVGVAVLTGFGALAFDGGPRVGGAIVLWFAINLAPVAVLTTSLTWPVGIVWGFPVLAVLVAGHRTALRSPRPDAVAGACVMVGYLPAVVGSYLFALDRITGRLGWTDLAVGMTDAGGLLWELLFVAVAMPVVIGAIGGWIAGR